MSDSSPKEETKDNVENHPAMDTLTEKEKGEYLWRASRTKAGFFRPILKELDSLLLE